jgi:hypothetical protein
MADSKVATCTRLELEFRGNDRLVTKWANWSDGSSATRRTFQPSGKTWN